MIVLNRYPDNTIMFCFSLQRRMSTGEHVEKHRHSEIRVQQLANTDVSETVSATDRHLRIGADLII